MTPPTPSNLPLDQPPVVSTLPIPAAIAAGDPAVQSLYALIAAQPFFKGLNPHQLQLLTDSALELRFETGEELMHEGGPANRFYLILDGTVGLETQLQERGIFPIQTLGPGDDLGWSWLFPPYLMNVSARALTPTRTIFFYGTRLREHCEQDHALGFQLMQRVAEVLIQRLETTQKRLAECIVTNKLSAPLAP